MEDNKKEGHKETLNNPLKKSLQKMMLLCGRRLVKAGNILSKIGGEEKQVFVLQEITVPVCSAISPVGSQMELQPVGDITDPDGSGDFNDSTTETTNEENVEQEIHDATESDGISSVSDVDETTAMDVDSPLSSIKLVRNAANLINEYDRLAVEAENDSIRMLYNDAATRLIENLIMSGCTSINPQEDDPFDFNRHATRPFSLPNNKLIKNTLRLGVGLNEEVLIKAIVELK